MIDVFEQYAPRWKNIIRDYAYDIWTQQMTDDKRLDYDLKASKFARSYRHALEDYYREKDMRVYRGTLDGKMNEWLHSQKALRESIETMITTRKDSLVMQEMERLKKDKSYDAQKMLNKIYEAKEGENVYKVFSFEDNFKDRAEQIGDDNAYELGRDINEAVVKQLSDIYIWETQRDKQVRDTHKQLRGKCFRFDDPPTTVTKYGKEHTGNPGTEWGCIPSGTKIRLNSDVIRCFRREFTGELAFFISESGITIRATGNHPVLTKFGWKPANRIQVGDYVVKVPDKSVGTTERDIYNTGIPVEQVFDFFSLCGDKVSVSGGTTQFHGDGIPEEKVDIVTVNRVLTNKWNIETGEFVSKLIFPNTNMMSGELFGSSEGEFNATAFRLGLSTFSSMSGSRDFHSLFGSGVLKANDVGLAPVSRNNSSFYDKPLDIVTSRRVSKELSSAGNSTHPVGVTLDDLVFERVTAIGTEIFNGHVYNLQTSTNWYIANGLSIHNCRCWAEIPSVPKKPLLGYVVYER